MRTEQPDTATVSNIVPLHRCMTAQEREAIDQATRDLYFAARGAILLLDSTRCRLNLGSLPNVLGGGS